MVLKDITAENMREIMVETESEHLYKILLKINVAANNDKDSITITGAIKKSIKEELESRGFKIQMGGIFNEIDTNISW